ncbi:aminoglycoside phosphotransferase family protein [Ferrimonas aestuarii]|uniref:Serine/threonine protein kinase n=1 Tax=Ferrimonas aestuarii TaxID=2569539 RepID=A0A4U1BIG4_9GAMM|nr:phosphotransferase [Ferrimonas aestuarii]TKB50916.1 serine/threonine protein kinase [Ferrimonas aestuarii]
MSGQDQRHKQLKQWLDSQFDSPILDLKLIFGDASFRRYFRFSHQGKSYIAADAPPNKEDSRPFVAMTQAYHNAELPAPELVHVDLELGFMCQSDLGDTHLQKRLTGETASHWYSKALAHLPSVLAITETELGPLPVCDNKWLQQELDLLPQWFLKTHLNWHHDGFDAYWPVLCQNLIDSAQQQPQGGMHRDYHSRNLMVVGDELAIIDYQGAMLGPITYDPVSLLKDCYISWPRAQVESWLEGYFTQLRKQPQFADIEFESFLKWFDLMGLQRHLKVLGIFARLCHRDAKPHYLDDLPRVLAYVIDASARYPETQVLAEFAKTWQAQLEPK